MSFSDLFWILRYLLQGKIKLYQCYTNVNWRTCEGCLSWHGRIVPRPGDFPAHDSCAHEVLAFHVWKIGEYRKKGERMRRRAEEELSRREKWRKALEILAHDWEKALALIEEAAQVDVYLPEVEELVEKNRDWLLENPSIRKALREILIAGWKKKFAKERYERQPEMARVSQEKFGLQRLGELLP
jgi:hypothetical protein